MAGTRIESKPERIRSLEAAAGSPQSAAYGRAPVCCPDRGGRHSRCAPRRGWIGRRAVSASRGGLPQKIDRTRPPGRQSLTFITKPSSKR